MRTALEEDNDNMVSELERKVRIECGGAAELVAIGGLTSQCPRCSRIAPHLDRPIAFGLAPPQVAALKGATQSIHDEVSEQNRMLGGMVRAALEHHGTAWGQGYLWNEHEEIAPAHLACVDATITFPLAHSSLISHALCPLRPACVSPQSDDFERTGGLMGGTLKRLEGLTRYAGGSSHMCSLIGFVVFAFVVLYWLMGKR
jgi:hypothetical protein